MENFYPSPKTLLSLEKETLRSVCYSGVMVNFPSLFAAMHQFAQNYGESKISLKCHFEVKNYRKQNLFIAIGANVSVNEESYSENNYHVLIIDKDKKIILRSIHFDFAPQDENEEELKPSMHIQVGGVIDILLGYVENEINETIELPDSLKASFSFEKIRIPSYPVCIITLLNHLFLEFHFDPEIEKLLKDDRWLGTVCEAEIAIKKDYFENAFKFLNQARDKQPFFHRLYSYPTN